MNHSPNSDAVVPSLAVKAADQKFCFACGHLQHTSSAVCPQCGAAQAMTAVVPPNPAPSVEGFPTGARESCDLNVVAPLICGAPHFGHAGASL